MQPLGIYGIGYAGGLGLGAAAAAAALASARIPSSRRLGSGEVLGWFAPALPAPALPGGRRFGSWLRMSLAAAQEALANQEIPPAERLGVIGATQYGSLEHTAAFVENMIRQQEAEPQPANFIYSVHNAAATHAAMAFKARGYNLTVTFDETSFEQAICLAARRLALGWEDRLLLLGVDEWHPLAHEALARFGAWRGHSGRNWLPGEGAAALWVGPAREGLLSLVGMEAGQWEPQAGSGAVFAAEQGKLDQALQDADLSWQDVRAVWIGGPLDETVRALFAPWRRAGGGELLSIYSQTGFYPMASAAILVLSAAILSGRAPRPLQFFPKIEKNPHRAAVFIYNRTQTGSRSWVIIST